MTSTAKPAELLPPLTQIPPDIACVTDYERYSQPRLDSHAWAYFTGGAADEHTLRENVAAFSRIRLRPRVMQDMADANTRLTLFGDEYPHPLFLAPVAFQKMAHPDGELAVALAASAMNAGMVVSTQSSVPLENIAQQASAPLWFQLYLQPDKAHTIALIRRAEVAGYRALALTIDAPVTGVRNREQRAMFRLPAGISAANLNHPLAPPERAMPGDSPIFGSGVLNHAARWQDLEWLAGSTRLPILVKGILTAEDAHRAMESGASGIIVSNHGGRTLDTLPSTIEALPPIAEKVNGRVPILIDGGIRRGTDVFKAMALGATATLIGKPYIHALAAAGPSGVAHVLHILRTELEMAMALTGRPTLRDIDASAIWKG